MSKHDSTQVETGRDASNATEVAVEQGALDERMHKSAAAELYEARDTFLPRPNSAPVARCNFCGAMIQGADAIHAHSCAGVVPVIQFPVIQTSAQAEAIATSAAPWTAQEVVDYLARGVLPEHLRSTSATCARCGFADGEMTVSDRERVADGAIAMLRRAMGWADGRGSSHVVVNEAVARLAHLSAPERSTHYAPVSPLLATVRSLATGYSNNGETHEPVHQPSYAAGYDAGLAVVDVLRGQVVDLEKQLADRRPDYAPVIGWGSHNEDLSHVQVLERLCKLLDTVWRTFDPFAHEPNDCVCPLGASSMKRSKSFRHTGLSLRWVEAAVAASLAKTVAVTITTECGTWQKRGDDT